MNLWGLRSTDSGDLIVIALFLIAAAGAWLAFLRRLPRLLGKLKLPQAQRPFQDFTLRTKAITLGLVAGVALIQGLVQNPDLFTSTYGEPLPAIVFEGALLLVFMCVVVRYVVVPPLSIVAGGFGHTFSHTELWLFAAAYGGGVFVGALVA